MFRFPARVWGENQTDHHIELLDNDYIALRVHHSLWFLHHGCAENGGHKNQLIDLTIPVEKLPLYEDKINMDVEVEVALMGEAKFYGI